MIKKYVPLFIIFVLALSLRFIHLGANPPSLTWDEVSWGYNAYSLGLDGRDEFGRFLPHDYLESFGDFKPPLYAYLDVIPVKLLGLTEYATRVPSALFGSLTVLLTFFLVRELFYQSKQKEILALCAAGLLAISPWHINLSRAAFEANVATFFLVGGVLVFLFSVRKNLWYLLLSAALFVTSMYTFNTSRIVAPFLVLLLAGGFWRPLFKQWKITLTAALFGVLLLSPTALFLISPQASLRFKEVNIFTDVSIVKQANQEIANDNNVWWSKIIHNRRYLYSLEYIKHYFDNLNPQFLFIQGDGNPKFSTQDVGQLYVWEAPILLFGIFLLLRKREEKWWIVPLWLIIGIIPAATARETPHALRIETTIPTFQILIAYGVVNAVLFFKRYRVVFISLVSAIALFFFVYYLHGYYAHYPVEHSGEWQYGYKEAITYIKSVGKKYNKVYLTDELGRPYIYSLFYLHYDPREFRNNAKINRDAFGFVHVNSFEKYYFVNDASAAINRKEDNLYIDIPSRVPNTVKRQKVFYLLNGNPVLVAYTI